MVLDDFSSHTNFTTYYNMGIGSSCDSCCNRSGHLWRYEYDVVNDIFDKKNKKTLILDKNLLIDKKRCNFVA